MRIKDKEIKDLFLDVAAEELCHLEMISATVNMLNGDDLDAMNATVGNVEAHVLTGLSPMLANASGYLWTAAYVNETGDAAADILSDIAAEQRAKVVYEYLYRQIDDKGVRETIDFLLNREEAHSTMFRRLSSRIQDTGSQKDWGTTHNARIYFDLSGPGGRASVRPRRSRPLLIFNFLPPQTRRICLCGGSASAGLLYRIERFRLLIAYVNRQKRRVTFKSSAPR